MPDFKPLDAQRAIRDDASLQRADKALLWSAVLRTDNSTRKVRASLAMLAKDAGYRPNAATRVFAETNPPVLRYFEKIDRQPRRVDLTFHPTDRLPTRVSQPESESTAPEGIPGGSATTGHSLSAGVALSMRVSRTVDESDPSAVFCPTSAYTLIRPSSIQGDEQATGTETPSGSPSEQPSSDEHPAPAEEPVEMCDLHVSFAAKVCPYPHEDKTSNHPEWKQRQWYEEGQRQNEAPGIDGYPVERLRDAGYRSSERA